MAYLHDLATTIGNSWIVAALSAVAAGLAVIALMNGTAKVRRSTLPGKFPRDSEAQLDKYAIGFNQLDQVAQNNPGNVSNLVEQLKHNPGPHLCLKAFEAFVTQSAAADIKNPPKNSPKNAKTPKASSESKSSKAQKKTETSTTVRRPGTAEVKAPAPAARGGDYDYDYDDDDNFPATVEVSLPKSIQDERNRQ